MLVIGLFFFLQGFGVGDEAGEEGFAGGVGVGVIASPGVEGGVLKGASKAEGDGPREGAVLDDGGEIIGGLFDGLTAREENDAGEFTWDVGF